jgi:molybdopterin converting factor small subunit
VPKVIVRYFAGARAAAGVAEEQIDLVGAATLEDLLALLRQRHGEPLRKVLATSSFLLDSVAVRDRDRTLADGAALDVLPPFAGG